MESFRECSQTDIAVEPTVPDVSEESKVSAFLQKSCCSKKCHTLLSAEEVSLHRAACAELSRVELDMAIMGKLSVHIRTDDQAGGAKKHQHARQRSRNTFFHHNQPICRDMFNFLHNISAARLKALIQHYLAHGLTPRIHGNLKRLPKHTLSLDQVQNVVTYIHNYAEVHALVLPGRIPGYKQSDIKLLPCSTTKHKVWEEYVQASNGSNTRAVAYSTFTMLWRSLGLSQLCWHNFRIIGTLFMRISIENNAGIIGRLCWNN